MSWRADVVASVEILFPEGVDGASSDANYSGGGASLTAVSYCRSPGKL
jgi:hypothetical protein